MKTNALWYLDTILIRPGVLHMPKLAIRKTVQLDAAAAIGLATP